MKESLKEDEAVRHRFWRAVKYCRAKAVFQTDHYRAGKELDGISEVSPVNVWWYLPQSLHLTILDSTQLEAGGSIFLVSHGELLHLEIHLS